MRKALVIEDNGDTMKLMTFTGEITPEKGSAFGFTLPLECGPV